jgi:hypothetical protein
LLSAEGKTSTAIGAEDPKLWAIPTDCNQSGRTFSKKSATVQDKKAAIDHPYSNSPGVL